MLIMQNIVFRIKKKTFICETAYVTSRQNFLFHNSECGVCQLHIKSTHQTFKALKCLFSIRHANIAHLFFPKIPYGLWLLQILQQLIVSLHVQMSIVSIKHLRVKLIFLFLLLLFSFLSYHYKNTWNALSTSSCKYHQYNRQL